MCELVVRVVLGPGVFEVDPVGAASVLGVVDSLHIWCVPTAMRRVRRKRASKGT